MNRPELNEEVRLWRTGREREAVENEGELFAVLRTLESLEKAYIRDCVGAKEYTAACQKLLVQAAASLKLLRDPAFPDIPSFARHFRMNVPAALGRVEEGRPITIKDDKGNASASIASIVSLFITVMDKLKLDIRAVDELQPDLRDLVETLGRMAALPRDFAGTAKVAQWLGTLDALGASDEISDAQARQMVFDFEQAYAAFNRFLQDS